MISARLTLVNRASQRNRATRDPTASQQQAPIQRWKYLPAATAGANVGLRSERSAGTRREPNAAAALRGSERWRAQGLPLRRRPGPGLA